MFCSAILENWYQISESGQFSGEVALFDFEFIKVDFERERMVRQSLDTDTSIQMLLVEDDEVDVMNVKRALKRKQLTVPLQVAQNGLDALKLLRQRQSLSPDGRQQRRLILLDLNMPRMGGLEFLQKLRQDDRLKQMPVVALTTSDDANDRRRAYQLNVAGYLLKSVAFADFAESMEALVKYWTLCQMP